MLVFILDHSPKISCYSVEPMTDDSITDMESPKNPCEQTWIWAAAKIRNHQLWRHVPCEFRLMPLAMRSLGWSRIRPIIYPCWSCNMWNQINARQSTHMAKCWYSSFGRGFCFKNLRGSTRINFFWVPVGLTPAARRHPESSFLGRLQLAWRISDFLMWEMHPKAYCNPGRVIWLVAKTANPKVLADLVWSLAAPSLQWVKSSFLSLPFFP